MTPMIIILNLFKVHFFRSLLHSFIFRNHKRSRNTRWSIITYIKVFCFMCLDFLIMPDRFFFAFFLNRFATIGWSIVKLNWSSITTLLRPIILSFLSLYFHHFITTIFFWSLVNIIQNSFYHLNSRRSKFYWFRVNKPLNVLFTRRGC